MLTVLFFVLLGMALAHFIYEKILLPSIRLHFRNKLFELRDRVRNELIENRTSESAEAAKLVHEVLNNAINRLHMMTLQNQWRARKRFRNDPSIQHKINRDVEILRRADNKVIDGTIRDSASILKNVLFFNSFMFFVYTLPVFILVVAFAKIVNGISQRIRGFISGCRKLEQAVMLLPDRMIKKLIDSDSECDAYARA